MINGSSIAWARGKRGFTLIEAIVAITIIGMSAPPILLLISETISQLTRAQDAAERAVVMESVLALIDPINPLKNPNGDLNIGGYSFTWESTVIVPPNETIQSGTGLGGHKIGFYNMEIEVYRELEPWFSFTARKVGYERFTSNLFNEQE